MADNVFTVPVGTTPPLQARVVGLNQQPLVQSDVVSADYTVTDVDGEIITVPITALVVNNVVFNTPQPWPTDSVGYNVMFRTGPEAFPVPGRYNVDARFVLNGNVIIKNRWPILAVDNRA
jgi:hypothetical protein